jgi:DNA-binding LytR/AlgR family response regulator
MIKCLIVDDEPLAIQLLESYVLKIDFLELVSTFDDPIKAIDFIQKNEIDLVFLDIQMPELSGINFMKILGDKAKYILTTAYSDYALEGYEHEVINYLMKPISFEKFQKSAESAKERLHFDEVKTETYFFIKCDGKQIRINFNEILYVESIKDYVNIKTENEEIIYLETLKSLENKLPKNFARVHKSYIINLEKIEKFETKTIFLVSKKEIPIGETYKSNFLNWFKNQ